MNNKEIFPFSKKAIDKENKQKIADSRHQKMLEAFVAGSVLKHLIETNQPDQNLQESWKQFQQTSPNFFKDQLKVKTVITRSISRLSKAGYNTPKEITSLDPQIVTQKGESPQIGTTIIGAVFDQWPKEILDQIPALKTELVAKLQPPTPSQEN